MEPEFLMLVVELVVRRGISQQTKRAATGGGGGGGDERSAGHDLYEGPSEYLYRHSFPS